VVAGPVRVADAELQAVLDRLLAASDPEDAAAFAAALDEAEPILAAADQPRWVAWRHALYARRWIGEDDADAARGEVSAAREVLQQCVPSAGTALMLAYLAHVEVTADHYDAAMLLAIDASLLIDGVAAATPSVSLLRAHFWLSLTLTGLDLEELAVEHAVRARLLAAQLPDLADRWRVLLLCAQQHNELAQTVGRRGDSDRARELAEEAEACATQARDLDWTPAPAEQDLLDLVQSWTLLTRGRLDDAVGPLRRVRRRIAEEGGVWLRGYADLAQARLLLRLALRGGSDEKGDEDADEKGDEDADEKGEEAIGLLIAAAGGFAAVGDRRRYRQGLLELGQACAALALPTEALHWLEAYRADAGLAHARGRELWAEMFVQRSRLREAERQTDVLRRHALEDPLTGLGNRRSAERRLGGLRLGQEPLSLAVVDVDRFKEVNDDTSHSHGDAVLQRVAGLLREHSRAGDEVYRWAGDEFLVVLPTATEEQAVGVMERLRAAVAGASWEELELPGPVTVSVGVATAPAGDENGPPAGWRALFDTADLHLFSAKRGGRNRVRSHDVTAQAAADRPTDEQA
jgi:diguanylate cyclase (GGDEF)-like protein